MSMYVDKNYYLNTYKGTVISDEETINKYLEKASSHIDSLTFNRIVAKGFDNLTSFQQDIVKKSVCELADFEFENADVLESVLSSYSINGVSMSFGDGANVEVINGVAIPKQLYNYLGQTGLTCKNARY